MCRIGFWSCSGRNISRRDQPPVFLRSLYLPGHPQHVVPPLALATRAITNSRSESRLR